MLSRQFRQQRLKAGIHSHKLVNALKVPVSERNRLKPDTSAGGILDLVTASALAELVPGDADQPRADRTRLRPVPPRREQRSGKDL